MSFLQRQVFHLFQHAGTNADHQMDSQHHWQDFHFLNSTFRDVVDANNATRCIETSLVRLSYRGSKTTVIAQTVKALDGLLVEYAVPFPLAYIFTPRVFSIYGSIFAFLLQIRRAKSVLERILVRGEIGSERHMKHEFKAFYAIRGKLSWFIKCVHSVFRRLFTDFTVCKHTVEFPDDSCELPDCRNNAVLTIYQGPVFSISSVPRELHWRTVS
jgi:gamma-tubulin complex component 5